MATWNPVLYLKFGEERTQPARDLAARAAALLAGRPTAGLAALDLGCGPGNSTAVLAATFPGAELTGMDSSPEMIAQAVKSSVPATWAVADAAAWEPGRAFDLVFSNAVLQWIPDQAKLLARMAGWLKPGGVLAVQVPGNGQSPLHRRLGVVAAEARWADRFGGLDDLIRYREPDFYFDCLDALGLAAQVWETIYWHVMDSHRAVLDWYRGTGMRPWLEALPDDTARRAFEAAMLDGIAADYPARDDGRVLFPFRRVFLTAVKPQGVAR
jgi:trans-aconitate 2-methyltransferase